MNGLTKEMFDDLINCLKYREVEIEYKQIKYHIENAGKKYFVGIYKKDTEEIEKYVEISGDTYDSAYENLLNAPLFNDEKLKDIMEKIKWISAR